MTFFTSLLLGQALATLGHAAHQPEPVASYTLTARLDEHTHRVFGTGTIRFRNPSAQSTNELFFHLYLNAFSGENTLFLRERGGRSGGHQGVRGGIEVKRLTSTSFGGGNLWDRAAEHSPGDANDRTDIQVPLPRPLHGGETVEFEIDFEAQLPEIVERTGYQGDFHLIAQWFPKLAKREANGKWAHFAFHPFSEFYADFGNYDITLDVPEQMLVGSTGKQAELPAAEQGRRRIRAVAERVHDFAWTAWAGFISEERQIDQVKVALLMPPHLPRSRELTWETIEAGLTHFGEAYGEYPYEQLTVVYPPASAARAGGMEYPQFITTGGEEIFPRLGIRAVELITIHELGHQWFQGLLATNEYEAPFLDEGINSFAEWRFMTEKWGQASLVAWPWLSVSRQTAGRYTSQHGRGTQPPNSQASEFSSFGALANLVYARAPLCLESLGRVFGQEKLHAALKRYALENRYQHPRAQEFYRAIEQEMGIRARAQLELMLNRNAHIDLSVRRVEAHKKLAPSHRGTVVIERAGSLELPFEVALRFANGEQEVRQLHGEKRQWRLEFEHGAELVEVQIDPEHRLLLDDDLLNNRWCQSALGDRAFQANATLSWASWLLALGTP